MLSSGRLVTGLVRLPSFNQLMIADCSYVNPSEQNIRGEQERYIIQSMCMQGNKYAHYTEKGRENYQ